MVLYGFGSSIYSDDIPLMHSNSNTQSRYLMPSRTNEYEIHQLMSDLPMNRGHSSVSYVPKIQAYSQASNLTRWMQLLILY